MRLELTRVGLLVELANDYTPEKQVFSLNRQTPVHTNIFVPVICRVFLSARKSQLNNISRIVKAEFCPLVFTHISEILFWRKT